jgi:serine/threonine protein kinase/Tfp pilus assembly protein PilF
MNASGLKAKEIFVELIGRVPPEEWDQQLTEACGDDDNLRRRVQALLRAHQEPDSFLEVPPAAITQAQPMIDQPPPERPGTQIGPYKLIEHIGDGGMGTVWMAQQTEPVRRLVAVKLIKAGMDSAQVIARFEAERQALALMDHANIARVLDAGATSASRPYFVMDLVRGIPITRYCDEHHLTPKQRLELFIPVCQAIQHAHQKGIIHRDLKPSNVLVALYDGKPVPKVIDFGVVKATGQTLTDKTLVTGFGAIVGTLEYMSPEQAEINQLDIDTRSDIYSLGVLLYELLTGSPPFSRKELEQAGMLEMLRVIREEEPSKPSTKLSKLSSHHAPRDVPGLGTRSVPATLASIAANRGTEPTKLTKLVRGELDWIVMKALEKDRNRRYETANGFAQDIEHYLNDEPVVACPPSAAYRFHKFARRNRAALASAASFAAVLLAATAVSGWLAVRATDAERQAKAEAQKARTEAAISRAINEFINQDLLDQANGRVHYGPDSDLKLRTVLDRAAGRIEGRFPDQPLVEAALRHTIGATYSQLGDYRRAAAHLQRAADLRREHLGEEHRDTLTSLDWLARARNDDATTLGLLEIRRRVLGADDPDTLLSLFNAARSLREKGDYPRAIALVRDLVARQQRMFGESHPDTAYSMHFLAHTLVMAAEPGPAEVAEIDRLSSHALAVYREKVGSGNWSTWDITVRRGHFLRSRGRFEEAEAVFREEYEALQRVPSAPPEWSAVLARELVEVYRSWGKPALATEWKRKQATAQTTDLFRKADLINERRDDPDALKAYGNLLFQVNRFENAAVALQKAVQLRPGDAGTHHLLAHALGRLDRFPEAEAAFRESIRLAPNNAGFHHNFGDLLRRQKKYVEAEAEYREAMRLDPKYAEPHLAEMLCREVGDFERGVPVLKELIRRRSNFAPLHDLLEMAEARQGTQAPLAEPVANAKEGDPR